MADRSVTYRFKGDVSDLISAMARAGAAAEALDEQLDGVNDSAERTGQESSRASQGVSDLGESAHQSAGQVDDLGDSSNRASRSTAELGDSSHRASDGTERLGTSARQSAAHVDSLGDSAETTSQKTRRLTAAYREYDQSTDSLSVRTRRLRQALAENSTAASDASDGTRELGEASRSAAHDTDELASSARSASREAENLGDSSRRARSGVADLGDGVRDSGRDIDRYSGRLRMWVDLIGGLGPALIPVAAGLMPAISGIAAGLGAMAGAAGVTLLAFNGVGDSLKALNKYQMEPTDKNLQAMSQQMQELGPAGAKFVRYLDSLSPAIEGLQATARQGFFPGLQEGMESAMTTFPQVQQIVGNLAATMGDLSKRAGKSLAGDDDWQKFFDYLQTDAAPILDAFGTSIGNFAAGFANMIVAFKPLTRDFSTGMVDMSDSFRQWTAGLSDNASFQSFLDYIKKSGPQLREFLGAVTDAIVGLVEAMAPWGSVVLPLLTGTAEAFAAIAKSPIGPVLATAASSLLLFSRAAKIFGATGFTTARTRMAEFGTGLVNMRSDLRTTRTEMGQMGPVTREVATAQSRLTRTMSGLKTGARAVAGVGGMVLLSNALQETSTAAGTVEGALGGAMAGFSVGGGWGALIGGAAGALTGLVTSLNNSADATDKFKTKWQDLGSTMTATGGITNDTTSAMLAGLRQELPKDRFGVGMSGSSLDWAQIMGFSESDVATALGGTKKQFDSFMRDLEANTPGGKDGMFGDFIADIQSARDQVDSLSGTYKANKAAIDASTQSLSAWTQAQREANQAALDSINSQASYGEAFKGLQDQMKKGTQGWNKYTEAGRANMQAVSNMVGSYNAQSESVKNNVKEYNKAKQALIDFGKGAGLSKDRIQQLVDMLDKPRKLRIKTKEAEDAKRKLEELKEKVNQVAKKKVEPKVDVDTKKADNALTTTKSKVRDLGKVTTKPKIDVDKSKAWGGIHDTEKRLEWLGKKTATPKLTVDAKKAWNTMGDVASRLGTLSRTTATPSVNANTTAALNGIQNVASALNGLHDKSVTVTTYQKVVQTVSKIGKIAGGNATGGAIHGPGTKTSDSIPTWLSDGEFVMRAAAVDKYGTDFMHALNQMRLATGGPVGFAQGGQAQLVQTSRPAGGAQTVRVVDSRPRKKPHGQQRIPLTLVLSDGDTLDAYIDSRIDAAALLDDEADRADWEVS